MSGYILVLIWLGFLALVANQKNITRYEMVNDVMECRTQMWFAVVAFLPVIIWAATRPGSGFVDTNAYIAMYQRFPTTWSGLIEYLPTVEKDVGFTIFGGIIKLIFGTSYRPFLVIIAIIQGGILIWFFQKYSQSYLISIFLFIATSEYLSWMFNGIRQFLAVVIIIAATPLMLKKKYVPLIITILVASTIHQTALLMIPVVFIVQGKPWNMKTVFFIFLTIGILLSVDRFTGFLDAALSETQYSATVSTWQEMNDDGSSPLRVLVYSIPAILSFIGRKQLENESTPIVNLCINMSIISAALYVISMVTSGIMLGRLPIYVSLYSYILMPYEIERIFTKDSAKLVKILMIVFYLLYYYYLMHFAYGKI